MPLYEYQCMQCGKIDEVLQKFSEKPLKKCHHCSGKLQKLISHSSFHLKGTGWYVTDYAGKSGNTSTTQEKAAKEPSAAKAPSTDTSESKSSKTKTEKSADTTS